MRCSAGRTGGLPGAVAAEAGEARFFCEKSGATRPLVRGADASAPPMPARTAVVTPDFSQKNRPSLRPGNALPCQGRENRLHLSLPPERKMSESAFRFTHAVTRRPAASILSGLRAVDTGAPDLALMLTHHAAYLATLRETGARVIELPALPAFPDSVFAFDLTQTRRAIRQTAIGFKGSAPPCAGSSPVPQNRRQRPPPQ